LLSIIPTTVIGVAVKDGRAGACASARPTHVIAITKRIAELPERPAWCTASVIVFVLYGSAFGATDVYPAL
jgi:hypothetical protein